MKILAIETSCDETSIAIIEAKELKGKFAFKILGNETATQINIHRQFGGVFPMMAKREHIKNLPIVFEKVLKKSKVKIDKIDLIAVTSGPGLEPALWTGIVFAKELSLKYKIPIMPINHMEGHIFSVFPTKRKTFEINKSEKVFPALSLLVSGGHTEIVLIKDWLKYKKIGQTRDDAVGEAFDKVARMLGLPYPGGPEISKLANYEREYLLSKGLAQADGPSREIFHQKNIRALGKQIPSEIKFPRPMIHSKDFDFSFSGLKTAVLYLIKKIPENSLNESIKGQIAKEFEDAAIEVLVYKTTKAVKEYKTNTLIVGGGVSANEHLKKTLKQSLKKIDKNIKIHFPIKNLSTDNALMIAVSAYFRYMKKKPRKGSANIVAKGNLSL